MIDFDSKMMQRCIELARRALGKTSPNPLVGAVVVKDGIIVGEGYHPAPGQPHAEVFALKAAGEKALGATVYVNLEPCNHYGRTPPCTEALIAAGVAKVVAGMVDPNPLVSGSGIERLRKAGIEVVVGVEESACLQLNEAFSRRIVHKQAFGILKYAMTLDGKIAASSGHSAWVTSKASRHLVHQLRAGVDAVIIGGNTLRQDNPFLTTHGVSDKNPLRVVMSRSLDLPIDANLWDMSEAPTIVFTEIVDRENGIGKTELGKGERLRDKGVEVVEVDSLTPRVVMEFLYERDLSLVLWECGGNLAAKAIADGVVQKIMAFIAPKIIGGDFALSPVGDLGLTKMTDALCLDRVSIDTIESDILLTGYIK